MVVAVLWREKSLQTEADYLKGKKVVIVGCGAQGLNQGLNMRDSGLDVSYALRQAAIDEQRQSFKNAKNNGFNVGSYEQLIPTADLVINLTPDKQPHQCGQCGDASDEGRCCLGLLTRF